MADTRASAVIRICWFSGVLLLLLPLVTRLVIVASTPVDRLRNVVDFIYDDGYYYMTLAANLAETGHSSLDGITATNGYQPLWLLFLTALAKLVGAHPYTYFVATCALIYAIASGTPLLAVLWSRGVVRDRMLCLGAGLAIVLVQQPLVFLRGLEPVLFPPVFMLLVASIERAKIDSRTLLQISAVLSVAFLIRLDALAVYAAVVICLPPYAVWNGKLHLRAALALIPKVAWQISVFVVPTVLVYMALNQWLFGAPVPISGLAKAIGGPRFANWGAAQAFLQNGSALVGFLVLLVMLELGVRRFDSPPAATFYRSIVITSVATAIQAFYYSAFSTWPVWPWYSYLVDMNLALIIARILYLCSLLYKPLSHPVVGARVAATATLLFIAAWTSRYTLTLSSITRIPVIADARQQYLPASHQSQNAAGTTYNEISLEMLDSFFPAGRVTRIAMGDRGGGLAYWGRDRLSVIQTEGILLDMAYIRARESNSGAEYLEHLPIDYLITDRETIANVVGTDGQLLYIVPDPVQGRVTFDPVPTFCFPANAVRYEKDYVSTFQGISKRLAFLFSARVPCPSAATSLVRSIETGIGLRQYSLPVEYDPAKGDIANKSSEDRDRRRAFRVSIRHGS